MHDVRFAWPRQPPLLAIDQLHVNAGELLMIHGPSGSGKTTLLSLMAGVLTPQQGKVSVSGIAINNLSAAARDRFRGEHIGVVFQQFNLLPYLSVLQNVMLPAELFDQRAQRVLSGCTTIEEGAQRVLSELDLQAALWHQPAHTLSVGQQQRVAVARALLGSPELIIADEPTSALDEDRQHEFMQMLMRQVKATHAACVMVTHQRSLGAMADRVVDLSSMNQQMRVTA